MEDRFKIKEGGQVLSIKIGFEEFEINLDITHIMEIKKFIVKKGEEDIKKRYCEIELKPCLNKTEE